LLKEEIF